jgi:serine/threonine-protein kinase
MKQVLAQNTPTQPFVETTCGDERLVARYETIVAGEELTWCSQHRKLRPLGAGGQGVVYLSERRGTDGFTQPVALKIFSPHYYRDRPDYEEDMRRTAQVAGKVALIQHDNVLDIHNFVEQDGIRLMEMEWVDGYDLSILLTPRMLDRARHRLHPRHWDYLNNVIVTAGPVQPRLKPGIAIQVLRECLAGLGAMHREQIVHGDIKPSNVMLKRTGHAKVIDIGSAIDLRAESGRRMWSPAYAASEVLAGEEHSARSDLASLGYVLIEMLSGRPPFTGVTTYQDLRKAKQELSERLPALLPPDVSGNALLLNLCRRLIAPDPADRFPSAEAADLEREGAAGFHRQLVQGNLASEYEHDLRVWLEQLG